MVAWNEASELKHAALGRQISLAAFAERERKVRRDFWAKLKRFAGMVPFVEDLVAAYYCALDPATPMRVRGMLLAALAYFILPADIIPDLILGLGFADDAALLTAVIGMVATQHHADPQGRRGAGARQGASWRKLSLRVDDHLAGDLAALDQGERRRGLAEREARVNVRRDQPLFAPVEQLEPCWRGDARARARRKRARTPRRWRSP